MGVAQGPAGSWCAAGRGCSGSNLHTSTGLQAAALRAVWCGCVPPRVGAALLSHPPPSSPLPPLSPSVRPRLPGSRPSTALPPDSRSRPAACLIIAPTPRHNRHPTQIGTSHALDYTGWPRPGPRSSAWQAGGHVLNTRARSQDDEAGSSTPPCVPARAAMPKPTTMPQRGVGGQLPAGGRVARGRPLARRARCSYRQRPSCPARQALTKICTSRNCLSHEGGGGATKASLWRRAAAPSASHRRGAGPRPPAAQQGGVMFCSTQRAWCVWPRTHLVPKSMGVWPPRQTKRPGRGHPRACTRPGARAPLRPSKHSLSGRTWAGTACARPPTAAGRRVPGKKPRAAHRCSAGSWRLPAPAGGERAARSSSHLAVGCGYSHK